MTRKAILWTERRTGGTFLASCLSNHPRVFFARGEPLHSDDPWRVGVPDEAERLQIITSQPHYDVAGCKLFRDHAIRPAVWDWLCRIQPMIIYLWREDYISQALSIVANQVYRATGEGMPTHLYRREEPRQIHLEPEEVLFEIERLQLRYGIAGDETKSNQAILQSGGFRVLSLTYEQMTGGKAEVGAIALDMAYSLCAFLGVSLAPLVGAGLRRAHHRPWPEYVSNWDEVREAIATRVDLAGFPAIDGGKQES